MPVEELRARLTVRAENVLVSQRSARQRRSVGHSLGLQTSLKLGSRGASETLIHCHCVTMKSHVTGSEGLMI